MALGIRLYSLEAAQEFQGMEELPYTVESALHFRLHEMVYVSGTLPEWDDQINFPFGLSPKETYSVGSEYIYSFLARILPLSDSFAQEIRYIQVGWFSALVPLLAWTLSVYGRSRVMGFWIALLYAVSLASVIRTMGIEISRENFSLPFLVAHLGCWLCSRDDTRRDMARWGFGLGSALCLACAMMTWDMIQFYLGIFMLFACLEKSKHTGVSNDLNGKLYLLHGGVLVLVSGLNPYLRSHLFWSSIPMILFYLYGILYVLGRRNSPAVQPEKQAMRIILSMCVFVGLVFLFSTVSSNYQHFGQLLIAKLKYVNQKPVDPSWLTFDQRIMWVPALHSANWALTAMYFPFTLILSLLALVLILPSYRCSPMVHEESMFLTLFVISLFSYILFVRFHVYLILFLSFVMILPYRKSMNGTGLARLLYTVLLFVGLTVEAKNTLGEPWTRRHVYYEEVQDLTRFMSDHVAPSPVLANFGVSASILTYGRCPILLHPKFETEEARKRVENYVYALYKGTESEFREWASAEGAVYFVHSRGAYAAVHPEYQMRYFADALEPSEDTAAWIFENNPAGLRYFRMVFENRAYRVFTLLSPRDEARAASFALEAMGYLEQGQYSKAHERALEALTLFPYEPLALKVADRAASKSQNHWDSTVIVE